jgi:cyclophilin family peptidyl-prolyl cis-trans isomerase
MKKLTLLASAALLAAFPLSAQEAQTFPAPGEIVAAAPAADWVAIPPSDLLVMDLAPDAQGKPRRVVIQLMPPPFSQGWIGNIRTLASAHWWDGTAIVRVQDNYVTQWGDPTEKKALPEGLAVVEEAAYEAELDSAVKGMISNVHEQRDPYALAASFVRGWPVAFGEPRGGPDTKHAAKFWPTHCYGMVGVGRNLSPDTGTGAELYTVIGHAPRHLDRNIALVGRIIEGMEHMSSLPRGTGDLGFYKTPEERTAILSVRLMSEMQSDKPLPEFEYLSTESKNFAAYADARANRRDPFFITSAGGADICNIPVPVRRKAVK